MSDPHRLPHDLGFYRFIAACRILRFPTKIKSLWLLKFMRTYFPRARGRDTFFFLTHEYYLSRYFTLGQRVDCAISHYRYESGYHGDTYHAQIYPSPRALTLWQRVVKGARYTLTLGATEDNRHEGDLSIFCLVNDSRVCRVSFSYVGGDLFGAEPAATMFVTRNQTDRNGDLQRFRDAFKQNSPPYFCLAAACGIAMANGMRAIYVIKDDAQIAYDERYAEGFRNSYSALWKALGAEDTANRHALKLPIPLNLAPFSQVNHRNRAAARRRNWLEIILSAREAMLMDRKWAAPSPIDTDTLPASCWGESTPMSGCRHEGLTKRLDVLGFEK